MLDTVLVPVLDELDICRASSLRQASLDTCAVPFQKQHDHHQSGHKDSGNSTRCLKQMARTANLCNTHAAPRPQSSECTASKRSLSWCLRAHYFCSTIKHKMQQRPNTNTSVRTADGCAYQGNAPAPPPPTLVHPHLQASGNMSKAVHCCTDW